MYRHTPSTVLFIYRLNLQYYVSEYIICILCHLLHRSHYIAVQVQVSAEAYRFG